MQLQSKISIFLENKRTRLIALVTLTTLYGILLAQNIAAPFWGILDDEPALFGIAAKSWIVHSPMAFGFGLWLPEWIWGGNGYFFHHPQFIGIPLYLSYLFFGVGEWQTRLPAILFSLLSLVVFWFLIERAFRNHFLTLTASFFLALFPTSVFFGRMMSFHTVVGFFTLLSFLLLLLIETEKKQKYVWFFLLSVIIGGLTDWTYFLASLAAWMYIVLRKDMAYRRVLLWTLPLAALFSVAITALQVVLLGGVAAILEVPSTFIDHTTQYHASFIKLILFRGENEVRMFTGIGLALALVGAVFLFRKKEHRLFAGMLAFQGAVYLALIGGWSLAQNHPFWSFHLIPFIALAAAYALQKVKHIAFIALVAIFIFESGWLVYGLFNTKSFEKDDYALFKKANRGVPAQEPICSGRVNPSYAQSFVFGHDMEYGLCANSRYAVMRRWEPAIEYAKQISYGFDKPFSSNIRKSSPEVALVMEIVKLFPELKARVAHLISGGDADYREKIAIAAEEASLRQQRGFTETECSTNFCFYIIYIK
ncbi:MAG: glycosyltransferase family 39 protein [Candidatus Liptonbacteria bacterium]|nr:glycosyltransferase family 39 protein [Candidatus Liptonbacteria bacterium]